MSTDELITLGGIVGANTQRLRESRGLTQAQLARELATMGSSFTKATLASLESGRRKGIDLGDMLFLAAALSPGPMPVSLHELVAPIHGQTSAKISDDVAVALQDVAAQLQGGTGGGGFQPLTTKASARWIEDRVRAESEEADRAIAPRLGVDIVRVRKAARRLWKSTATEERDRRVAERLPVDAGARKVQAVRGHVTRDLTREVEARIRKGGR